MKPTLQAALLAFTAFLALLSPLPALADHPVGPPPGQVMVTNQSGGDVTIALTGQPPKLLPAWQTASLYGPFGESTLRATYTQLGATRTLQSDRVSLHPRRTGYVVLRPETRTRVLVTNATRTTADLLVNDRVYGRIDAGASRTVSVAVGRLSLALLVAGRRIDATSFNATAFAEHRWIGDDPTGDLVVVNPLPIPIELVCPRGLVRTVPARGQVVYEDLPAGSFRLTARRVTDERIDDATTPIHAGGRAQWVVSNPTTGLVALDSDHWLSTRVSVDEHAFSRLAAYQDARVELPLGWHRVQVRDEQGRLVEDEWVNVEAFTVASLDFGRGPVVAQAERDHDDHHDHGDRDDHDHTASCGH